MSLKDPPLDNSTVVILATEDSFPFPTGQVISKEYQRNVLGTENRVATGPATSQIVMIVVLSLAFMMFFVGGILVIMKRRLKQDREDTL